jgi:hypothetical protein
MDYAIWTTASLSALLSNLQLRAVLPSATTESEPIDPDPPQPLPDPYPEPEPAPQPLEPPQPPQPVPPTVPTPVAF